MSSSPIRSSLLCFAAFALASTGARAELASGDDCRLSSGLVVKLRNSVQGSIETELARGTEITITDYGLQFTRILAGEVEALAPTEALEAVCAVPREICLLQDAIKMATSDKSGREKVFKVKAGAKLSVLERGAARSRVLVGGVVGRVNTDHLDEKCRKQPLSASAKAGGGQEPAAADPLRGVSPAPAGTRVAVLAFAVAPSGSAIDARVFEDEVTKALLKRRGDIMGPRDPRPDAKARLVGAKQYLANAGKIGAEMGVPFVVTGHLSREGETRLLALSVYNVKTGRVVRSIRARPTYHKDDPWADVTTGLLNEVLPGGSKYVPPAKAEDSKAKPPSMPVQKSSKGAWRDGPPWYTNGLAYSTLGAGVLLATGGALTGYWASTDVEAHGTTAGTDPARGEIANAAMAKGIVADSLYATAALAAVASLVFFVSGLDWDDV